jgi:hypothetical protein
MDMHMPVVDGVAAIEVLAQDHPNVAVIASVRSRSRHRSPRPGGRSAGLPIKDVEPEVLFAGIRAVLTGGVPLSPRVAAQLIRSKMSPSLSDTLSERNAIASNDRRRPDQRPDRHGAGVSRATVTSVCGRIFKHLDVSTAPGRGLGDAQPAARNPDAPRHDASGWSQELGGVEPASVTAQPPPRYRR